MTTLLHTQWFIELCSIYVNLQMTSLTSVSQKYIRLSVQILNSCEKGRLLLKDQSSWTNTYTIVWWSSGILFTIKVLQSTWIQREHGYFTKMIDESKPMKGLLTFNERFHLLLPVGVQCILRCAASARKCSDCEKSSADLNTFSSVCV